MLVWTMANQTSAAGPSPLGDTLAQRLNPLEGNLGPSGQHLVPGLSCEKLKMLGVQPDAGQLARPPDPPRRPASECRPP